MDAFLDARQALIDNPPPKCPYFTLPDVGHFQKIERPQHKPIYASITGIWGLVHKMTDESSTEFLLQLLKHSKWEPDFDAVAKDWNVNGSSAIRTRLKVIVENRGYKLVGGNKIVGDKRPPVPSAVSNSKARTTPKTPNNRQDMNATPRTRKRKSTGAEDAAGSKKIKKQKGHWPAGDAADSQRSEPVIAKGTEKAAGADHPNREVEHEDSGDVHQDETSSRLNAAAEENAVVRRDWLNSNHGGHVFD